MTYAEAKRDMDAAERRLMFLQQHCTVATLPDYRRARRAFDKAARAAHSALWRDIQERQCQSVPLVTCARADDLRRRLKEARP